MSDGDRMSAFLRVLAERAATDPAYLAWVVRRYAEAEGRLTSDVLAQLGVAQTSAADFLISLRPTGERYAEMLTAICVGFAADEPMLLSVLREVDVLDAFRAGSSSSAGVTDAGLLMAARMREESASRRSADERADVRRDDEPGDNEGNDAR